MDRKVFRQIFVFLILLMTLFSSGTGAFALENTHGVITEERTMERDGQKIYGKLYLPEETDAALPLVILSHGLGSDHRIMEPYVPPGYTQRAGQVLDNARTVIIEGAGHGFSGEDRKRVERESVEFVQRTMTNTGPGERAAA